MKIKKLLLCGVVIVGISIMGLIVSSANLVDKFSLSKSNPDIPLKNPVILNSAEIVEKQKKQETEDKRNLKEDIKSDKESQKEILKIKEKIDSEFNQRKKIQDDNDLKAEKILKDFYKKDVVVLTDDKYEDYKTMGLILDAIKRNSNFSNDELTILKNYLSRRLPHIDDNSKLVNEISEVLN